MSGKLPKGARLLRTPVKRTIAGWVEMDFDAQVERFGITWLRVKDGMGGSGKQEDWVADIPSGLLSVHDYHWNGDSFGLRHYRSFNAAIVGEAKAARNNALAAVREYKTKAAAAETSVALLEAFIRKATK